MSPMKYNKNQSGSTVVGYLRLIFFEWMYKEGSDFCGTGHIIYQRKPTLE